MGFLFYYLSSRRPQEGFNMLHFFFLEIAASIGNISIRIEAPDVVRK